jgi:hypothetical protein
MTDVFLPAYDFDQYFGKKPEEYFNEKRIAAAEKVYAEYIAEKQDDVLHDMVEMVEKMLGQLGTVVPGETIEPILDSIYAQAFSIKCNAGMYGYPLATAFANQLFYYCKEIAGKPLNTHIQACMKAHLDALRIIFKKNIRSMSDPVALELLKELERIGEK